MLCCGLGQNEPMAWCGRRLGWGELGKARPFNPIEHRFDLTVDLLDVLLCGQGGEYFGHRCLFIGGKVPFVRQQLG